MAKKQKQTRRSRGMRGSVAFLVTFIIFFIVFGGVMIWGVSEFWRQTEGPSAPTEPTTAPTVGYTSADARRLLLVTEDGGEAMGFVLLSAEPGRDRVRVIPLPRETAVTVGTQQTRLFEVYKSSGIAVVREQVAALTGLPVDNYAVLTYDGVRRLITYLGDGVIFTLPEAVSYEDEAGIKVNMKSGARTLSATQATDLLRYDGWSNGARGRANMQGELFAAMIDQYLIPSRFDEADKDFHALMNFCRSDILVSQFAGARGGLLHLAQRNQNDVCRLTPPDGEMVGYGEALRFEMAEETAN